jgi:hypothetical protein
MNTSSRAMFARADFELSLTLQFRAFVSVCKRNFLLTRLQKAESKIAANICFASQWIAWRSRGSECPLASRAQQSALLWRSPVNRFRNVTTLLRRARRALSSHLRGATVPP